MIESINNERVKLYSKLKEKKYRDLNDLFIVEGQHLVSEALKEGYIKEILLLIGEKNVYGNVTYVTNEILKKITSLDNPPKVLAVSSTLKPSPVKGNVLIIDDLKDPGNLGTIIRSCAAFDYETVLISKESVSIYNPKVIRATEGMIFKVNIIIGDILPMIKTLKENKYTIYGTDVNGGTSPKGAAKSLHALVIGNEAIGVSKQILNLCDQKLYIKMDEKCESLNASISASILMYELND